MRVVTLTCIGQIPSVLSFGWNLGLAARPCSAGWELARPCSLSWVLSLLWGERGYWAFGVMVLDSLYGYDVIKGVDKEPLWGVAEKDPRC